MPILIIFLYFSFICFLFISGLINIYTYLFLKLLAAIPGLSFLQANLDHTRVATSHLIDYVEARAINITIVGDPYVRSGRLPGLPSFITQVSRTVDPKILVLLQSVSLDMFPVFTSEYVVALRFSSHQLTFLFVAIYAAPSADINIILGQVAQVLVATSETSVLLGGDLNAKSPLWGGPVTDARGVEVVQFLSVHILVALNDPHSQPTFCTDYSEAWIDVTIASQVMADNVTRWWVSDTPTLSDHRCVLFSLESRMLPTIKRLTRAGQSRVVASRCVCSLRRPPLFFADSAPSPTQPLARVQFGAYQCGFPWLSPQFS